MTTYIGPERRRADAPPDRRNGTRGLQTVVFALLAGFLILGLGLGSAIAGIQHDRHARLRDAVATVERQCANTHRLSRAVQLAITGNADDLVAIVLERSQDPKVARLVAAELRAKAAARARAATRGVHC